jgi:CheY-like chemotaxis protein
VQAANARVGRQNREHAFRGATVLLVDDDNAVREVTRAMLHDLGYLVLEAGSGGAALDLIDRTPRLDLMIVDFAMPGVNGAEVARLACRRRANLAVLFITGFAERSTIEGIAEPQILRKPFMEDELAERVRAALASTKTPPLSLRHREGAPLARRVSSTWRARRPSGRGALHARPAGAARS